MNSGFELREKVSPVIFCIGKDEGLTNCETFADKVKLFTNDSNIFPV